jgi:hypothetical protein
MTGTYKGEPKPRSTTREKADARAKTLRCAR